MKFLLKNLKEKKQYLPFLIILSILCWAVFFQSLNNQFVSDDILAFVKSDKFHKIEDVLNWQNFTSVKLTYAISYQLFGLNPLPLHILALIMHNINCILLFFLTLKLFKNKKIAYISSVLFSVHPLVTEPLNWISARHYIFNTLLVLSSTLLYLDFRKTKKRIFLVLSLAIATLGTFALRSAWSLILPFFIVNAELFFIGSSLKLRKKKLFPLLYFIVGVIFIGTYFMGRIQHRFKYMQNRETQQTVGDKPNYGTRLSYTVGSAAKLLVYPKDLSLYHEGNKVTNLFLVGSQILIVFTAILLFYWIIDEKYKVAGLLTGMYISLLPAFSPLQVSWYIADRYLYLTTAFFTIFLGLIFIKLDKKIKIKKLSLVITLLILGAYIYKDYLRNQEWQNRKTLWEATARTNPNSARVYNNLGDVYAVEGNIEKAKQSFQKAIEINPLYAEAMYNLGNLYKTTGEEEKGQELIDEALKINPTMLE